MKKIFTSILLVLISITMFGCSKNIQTPVVLVENVASIQDSITFEVNVTDKDLVGAITSINLYQGETLIESLADLTVREFTGLLSNTAYTIEVIYMYDLDDNEGEQSSLVTYDESTQANGVPTVLVENIVATNENIVFEVSVTDSDQVGEIASIELYQGETLIASLTDLTVREFTGLLSNTAYTIEVTYMYDLLDGFGARIGVLAEEEFFTEHLNDINEESFYTSKDEVAYYIATFHKLPNNYMTKSQAGGQISSYWTPESMASIGGDSFYNRENLLPKEIGRLYYEVDINYQGSSRGAERIVFSNDGFIFYTSDHYASFVLYDPITKEWNDYSKDDLVFQNN